MDGLVQNLKDAALAEEWDKTFPKSEKVNHGKATFHNRYGITLAADLSRTDFADIQNKKECGGNRQWQRRFLRNWAANTSGKEIT